MKALTLRCLLVLFLGLLLFLMVLIPGLRRPPSVSAYSPPHSAKPAPKAAFSGWQINEIFSCVDGSIQFIELFSSVNGQEGLGGQKLRAANTGLTQTKTFTFSHNSGTPTASKFLLLATPNFGALTGGVTPDYIISPTFIFTKGGSLAIVGGDVFTYAPGSLPVNGIHSLNGDGLVVINSPKNFAGQQGSVTCPPGTIKSLIYLPLILKAFPLIDEHDSILDLPLDID